MTLAELSAAYDYSASLLRRRIWYLRRELNRTEDPEVRWHLKHRIAELTPMLTQMNELADGSVEALALMSKRAVAERIVRACEDFCA